MKYNNIMSNTNKTTIHKKIIKSVIIIFIISVMLFTPMFPRLVLKSVKNDKINVLLKINKKEFIISYMHSVNKSKVRDYYSIDKNKNIILEKTRFVSYGAGIPEPRNGENFIINDDYMEINNMNRAIKDLYLFIGTIANHNIMIDDKIFELNKIFIPQTNIKIEYENVSILSCLRSFIRNIINKTNIDPI